MAPSPPTTTIRAGRRYEVLGLLGKGGFGKVYRARMEGPGGFTKDVALKVLSDATPHPEVLTRFRDEARILALVRDRNVVSVEPPIRIGGRWAVVMEYAEGCDCDQLLAVHGMLPAKVALEIVGEVGRTLDNLWNHTGEDGEPLRLIHRDLKPANIKVSPTGAVKLLDFGVAHAQMERETGVSEFLTGTIGYIAPERLDGIEDHKGDVYSLGVMLEELLSGHSPNDEGAPTRVSRGSRSALELAEKMRSTDPAKRPSAAQVEKMCGDLADELPGPGLREWSKGNVMSCVFGDDPLNGTVIEQDGGVGPGTMAWASVAAVAGGALVVSAVAIAIVLIRIMSNPAGLPPPEPLEAGEEIAEVRPPGPALPEPVGPGLIPHEAPLAEPGLEPSRTLTPRGEEGLVVGAGLGEPAGVDAAVPDPPVGVPVESRGRVEVIGDHDGVRLIGEAGDLGPGVVPPGVYEVQARFGELVVGSGTVDVPADGVVELRCARRFKRCTSD